MNIDQFALGHSYLMMDDLQQAYAAYQNALVNLPNPKVRRFSGNMRDQQTHLNF